MRVYEIDTCAERLLIVDRQNGDPLILIPERGDVVCTAAWHLPESATELMSDYELRYEVLGQVAAKLADVEMSKKAQAGVKDALASLRYEE